MIDLPLEMIGYKDKDAHELKIKDIMSEPDLKDDDIRRILKGKLENKYLITEERNHVSRNENPFDIIIGDESTLSMVGFEIKGDTDTYSRLKTQLQAYSFCFQDIYLVLHKKNVPEWLPEYVGVIRVFSNGEAYIEKSGYIRDLFDIGSEYEWSALFKNNGLGMTSNKTRRVLGIIRDIRKNILFNRFFAVHEGYNTGKFTKFYPFTDEQKTIIIGFDVPMHYNLLVKEIVVLERRFDVLKNAIRLGQTGLDKFSVQKSAINTRGKKR